MSILRGHADPHARIRGLISQRLDEPLTADETAELRTHLLRCARCRGVDRDFRAQRVLLRQRLRSCPPRDLWARTSAALDREVAKHPRAGVSREPLAWHAGSPRTAAAAVVGLMVVVALIGDQLSSHGRGVTASPGVGPTPFEVPSQELTFVGHDTNGFAIYRTDVSRMCPAQSIDCTTVSARNRQVVRLRGERSDQELRPDSVAFHPNGSTVAIAAGNGRGEAVYVVFLRPVPDRGIDAADETSRPVVVIPAATPAVASLAVTDQTATGALLTKAPGATVSAVAGSGGAGPTGAVDTTRPVSPTGPPAASAPGGPSMPPLTTSSTRPVRTPRSAATASAAATLGRDTPRPSETSPRSSLSPASTAMPGSSGSASPSDSTRPSAQSPTAAASGADAVDDQVVQPILEDVLPTGADPAWSPDGDALAFSAMPADRSQGPDLYVWRNGEQHAEQLTHDHRSYFASWAGARIVASRAPRSSEGGELLPDDPRVSTVVMDLRTGEQRRVHQGGLWLPAVDPTGRFAIVWRGQLHQVGPALAPVRGALYLADWRDLDPFARQPQASPSGDHGSPDPAAPQTAAQPVEPDRSIERDPVLDWQVRWNDTGDAYGFWVGESAGAAWGRLAIVGVDRTTGRTVRGDALLGPTLAKRVFSLGQDRAAWVAPVEDEPEGELRVRSWGSNGDGTLRIRDLDAGDGVPGF